MELDITDRKLLALLQANSKQTTKQLSLHLDLSVTAVYERIRKLERAQIITDYVALVDKEKVNKGFTVFCHVGLVRHSKTFLTAFEKKVQELDEVKSCFHVSGDYDYILHVLVKDMDAYRDFMVTKLTSIEHIGNTHSSFIMSEVKNSSAIAV
ncbi:Lrp/AsnC family transcriptional regulator [Spongiivirga citrea]|uniref:Winged helix-turn-helix transcriptional regulator n=1 Tax=Spongiivirga citrea TaxID=1481457 RepID=A0A6M0CLQ2_9FLAO|nr:Lrp/AsnC family transcriptional regulator [Spongiivirga citrea]NER16347.1 winged helix-turn-helix transcriptional regulator [Spongiivirga citrea]